MRYLQISDLNITLKLTINPNTNPSLNSDVEP